MITLEDRIEQVERHLKALRREAANRRRRRAWRDKAKRAAHGAAVSNARIAGHPDFAGFTPAQIELYRALRQAGTSRADAIAYLRAG